MIPGNTFWFTFPFWIYVDLEALPDGAKFEWDGATVLIYPPFRSAAANYLPIPAVSPERVPSRPGAKPVAMPGLHFEPIAVVPLLRTGETDGFPVMAINKADWGKRPRTFPMDSLRVDIYGAEDSSGLAVELVAKLLASLRSHSAQWWIGYSAAVFSGFLRQQFPISPEGSILFDGKSVRITRVRTVDGSESVIDRAIWDSAIADVSASTEPSISRLLLLDARYHAYAGNIWRGVLDSALACEHAKDAAFERAWRVTHPDKRYSRGRALNGYDLEKHIDRDLLSLFQRSYRQEFEDQWSSIASLWSARGNVAHAKKPFYYDSHKRIDVDEPEFRRLLSAAEHCIRWLDGIAAGANSPD